MKQQTKLSLLCAASIALLSGCGGGGDDGDDTRNFAGTWSGALTKTSDTCATALPQTVTIQHTVRQNEEAIVLRDLTNQEYLGNTVGQDGFSVDANTAAAQCRETKRFEYHDIDDDDDITASIDFKVVRDCPAVGDCDVTYTGTASRGAQATPGATATTSSRTPGPTPTGNSTPGTTPVSGGCAAMNPNPAAGTYEGDGGCGLSSTFFRITNGTNGSVVLLNPFGANGSTSFPINNQNSSVAASTRSDLTINGEGGYSCSLTCSPPGTFTTTCFKEGGTQCVEKF